MIQPVRPVGVSVSSGPHVLSCIRWRLPWALAGEWIVYAAWGASLMAEGIGSRTGRVVIPLSFAWSHLLHTCPELLSQKQLMPVDPWQKWQAWPAHGAFANEVVRWWPSNDWPSIQPAPVIEDTAPDAPLEIISWRDRGGLLDMWM